MTDMTTDRRRRGPSYDRALIDKAKERRRYGDSYRVIAEEFGVPATTVQYWTQSVTADKSGRWHLSEAVATTDPDPVLVLRELAAVTRNSGGRVSAMTRDEARWVTLLAKVRPDIAPGSLWQLARSFLEAGTEADTRHWEAAVVAGLRDRRLSRADRQAE